MGSRRPRRGSPPRLPGRHLPLQALVSKDVQCRKSRREKLRHLITKLRAYPFIKVDERLRAGEVPPVCVESTARAAIYVFPRPVNNLVTRTKACAQLK